MLGGTVAAMPVVQPVSAPVAAPTPAPPARPGAPSAPRPGLPGPPRGQAPRPPGQAKKEEESGQGALIAIVVGALVLGGGLIFGAIKFMSKLDEKATASLHAKSPEEIAHEAARRAEKAKAKQEEEATKAKQMADLAAYLCNGDTKIAKELLTEFDSVSAELNAIYADADSNNDPKDLREFWNTALEAHFQKNNVLHHWLGGRPATFVTEALWGEAPEAVKPRSKAAEFLDGGGYNGNGTGFYIASAGWLLTNEHVVRDAKEVDIRGADGVIRKAQVVKVDKAADIALLRAEKPAEHWISLASSDSAVGSDVCTLGFPRAGVQGVEPKFTTGIISSLSGYRDDEDNYQTSVPIQPGNSGGPLVEMKTGKVSGITNATLSHETGAENVSYAIKVSVIQRTLSTVPEAAAAATQPASDGQPTDTVSLAANLKSAIVMVLTK